MCSVEIGESDKEQIDSALTCVFSFSKLNHLIIKRSVALIVRYLTSWFVRSQMKLNGMEKVGLCCESIQGVYHLFQLNIWIGTYALVFPSMYQLQCDCTLCIVHSMDGVQSILCIANCAVCIVNCVYL